MLSKKDMEAGDQARYTQNDDCYYDYKVTASACHESDGDSNSDAKHDDAPLKGQEEALAWSPRCTERDSTLTDNSNTIAATIPSCNELQMEYKQAPISMTKHELGYRVNKNDC